MELWIRTQDKKNLIKVDYISYEIAIEDKHILWYKSIDLGTYKTEERALEVLDEIHNAILTNKVLELTVNKIPVDELDTEKASKLFKNIVYEMPKE